MRRLPRVLAYLLATLLSLALLGIAGVGVLYLYLSPQLPEVDSLRDVRFQQPLRVFSADDELIAEFGDYRREPLRYEEIPERLKQAFIAAEDERFFSHYGVDPVGLARAVVYLARHREIGPGGSTITMQTARNFFLSREQTYLRKLNEILLSFKIERELDKEQILELYLNKIYLGQRAYGVGAAARIYYGRPLSELTLAETAMIAGLPKAPSIANPITNPERALHRRSYVLRRMHHLGYITQEEFAEASAAPVTAAMRVARPGLQAPYVAEMARALAVDLYGESAYEDGYRVYTTVDSRRQEMANEAVSRNLLAYDERHGYRGSEARYDLDEHAEADAWNRLLRQHGRVANLQSALVLSVDDEAGHAEIYTGGERVELPFSAIRWARPWVSQAVVGQAPERPSQVVSEGDLIRVRETEDGLRLAQVPDIQGSLVSLAPDTGAIVALVGGFDFRGSQFNRAAQALRQPGSAFKPFIYSAALERGFTPASVVNDAPVVFEDDALETVWRPENYSGRFYGPTRLREALAQSRNLVSIRVLRDIGPRYAVTFLDRFGFPSERMPTDLSLALGSAAVTPLELTAGYAVFANGGYRVEPYVVSRIEDGRGQVVYENVPTLACEDCQELEGGTTGLTPVAANEVQGEEEAEPVAVPRFRPAERTLSASNAYLMTSMMQDVIRSGTGRAARQLGRDDLAGKTGTTNDLHDAWFAGYNAELVTTAWVGFDQARSMGPGETGARTALPMWLDYMGKALDGVPSGTTPRPSGMVTVRIDADSGLVTSADNPRAMFETFRQDQVPEQERSSDDRRGGSGSSSGGGSGQPLF
ncbi:MAG: penicillin-binding protein 1A [Ectothiorhodospiraceae bacterium]|nr:penicillin-binding protein 1A [Ectothiorhodospiraceae bacterium]